jgi:hypothetical protein
MIKKSSKSLSNTLIDANSTLALLSNTSVQTLSAAAYTKARAKLNYTAFTELSNLVRDDFYEDGDYQTYKGFRLLAVDGSIVTLPNTKDVKCEFTPTIIKNQIDCFSKEVVLARASVLYDVLNNIVIDSSINDKSIGERALALKHLEYANKNDLTLYDRGYPSYELFASIANKSNYVIRIRKNSFSQAKFLFDINSKIKDIAIDIEAPKNISEQIKHISPSIKVRFIRVVLNTGEVEVVATNVLDSTILQTKDFKELYQKRWGIETFYHIIKNRLSLENFTALSALGIKQDFFITMFLSNYESLLTYDTNIKLREKTKDNRAKDNKAQYNKHVQKVNKSVSFNIIKQKSFELFYADIDIDELLVNMQKLFMTNTFLVRADRTNRKRLDKNKDKSTILTNSNNYLKLKKKVI